MTKVIYGLIQLNMSFMYNTAKYVIYVQEKEERTYNRILWNSKLFLVSERRLHFFNYILTGP